MRSLDHNFSDQKKDKAIKRHTIFIKPTNTGTDSIEGLWGNSHMMRSSRSDSSFLPAYKTSRPGPMKVFYTTSKKPADLGKRNWNDFFRALREGFNRGKTMH